MLAHIYPIDCCFQNKDYIHQNRNIYTFVTYNDSSVN